MRIIGMNKFNLMVCVYCYVCVIAIVTDVCTIVSYLNIFINVLYVYILLCLCAYVCMCT